MISPILFCVYLDVLLLRLKEQGEGCYMGPYFVGAMSYADDIILLAPSVTAMQNMLKVCDMYASEYDLTFNGAKSQYMCINHKQNTNNNVQFFINNKIIEKVPHAKHLGHVLHATSKGFYMIDIEYIISSFNIAVNKPNMSWFVNTFCQVRKLVVDMF